MKFKEQNLLMAKSHFLSDDFDVAPLRYVSFLDIVIVMYHNLSVSDTKNKQNTVKSLLYFVFKGWLE